MYLHLGNDIIVKKNEIVGIFELDGKVTTSETGKFLREAQKRGVLESAGDDLPKSFVVVKGEKCEKVYLSHISVASLLNRCSLPF
ncbi:MAG: DUF370 domain-containing protein [Clostridia bacterium]|nr:DUF370 domain-containing protein [Clostridia bacterium]